MAKDFLDQYVRLEDRVRRLELRDYGGTWPWYSLKPYLAGGWIDPFATNGYRVYPDDGTIVPGHPSYREYTAGFFDTGQALIFTGAVQWEPVGWFPSHEVPWSGWNTMDSAVGLDGGNPPTQYDGFPLITFSDGFLNMGASASYTVDGDVGFPLPYRPTYMLPNNGGATGEHVFIGKQLDEVNTNGSIEVQWYPAYTQVNGDSTHPADGMIIAYPNVRAGAGEFADDNGYTHFGIPEATVLSIEGNIIPYDTEFVPTISPYIDETLVPWNRE